MGRGTFGGCSVFGNQWKSERLLAFFKNSLLEDSVRLKNIITRLERSGIAYTSDSLVELYCASTENNGFVSFTLNLIKELNQIGKHRTAETYMTTLNSFIRFRKGKDVLLEEVDSSLMMKYESYLSLPVFVRIPPLIICGIFGLFIIVLWRRTWRFNEVLLNMYIQG